MCTTGPAFLGIVILDSFPKQHPYTNLAGIRYCLFLSEASQAKMENGVDSLYKE
jgi:hypothetical protein